MDIYLLSKIIKELILDNEEVTLPGIGTFTTDIIPSSFSDKGYTINPPYRRLSFRHKEIQGDNKLANFYATKNNIDLDVANNIIRQFLQEIKQILLNKKVVVFPELGRLRATKENNLFFVADEELDIYLDGFGLEPLSLKTHNQSKQEVAGAVANLKSIFNDNPQQPNQDIINNRQEETNTADFKKDNNIDIEKQEDNGIEQQGINEVIITANEADHITAKEDDVQPIIKNSLKTKSPKGVKIILYILLVIIALFVIAIITFVLLAHYAPETMDKILYTPQELEIIKQQLR